ncbi:S26 family signal peptidase [Thioalkalivibrio sp. ALgr3]|uniref:S26 family signal peptidase n=1 Tax=Thioalkalivibrio sp. ALgr3 TaxID=1239292 RepID=UPI00037DF038|nr:S26 family signal peptidase [Thioalkalivibrio sp. ALgr3]
MMGNDVATMAEGRPDVPMRVRVLRAALVTAVLLAWPVHALVGAISDRYMFALNLTESLPERVFWVERVEDQGDPAMRSIIEDLGFGDRIAFFVGEGARDHYRPETVFVKEVRGVAGQKVTVDEGRIVHIDGQPVATAKPESRMGIPLDVAEEGVIPNGKVFVMGSHEDSYDSRYADVGLVDYSRLIGTVRFQF